MDFPREVPHGLPVNELTKEFNKAVRVLRALRPVSSTTVRVESVSNGTTFHARPAASPRTSRATAAAAPLNLSFMAEARKGKNGNQDYFEVRMLGGTVQGLFGTIETIPTTFWTSNHSPNDLELFDDYDSGAGDVKHIHDGISNGDQWWLEYDPEESAGSRWSVQHGASLPASATVEDPDDARYFTVVPLFRVRGGGSSIAQGHVGAVFVPTATNVVDIQDTVEEGEGE